MDIQEVQLAQEVPQDLLHQELHQAEVMVLEQEVAEALLQEVVVTDLQTEARAQEVQAATVEVQVAQEALEAAQEALAVLQGHQAVVVQDHQEVAQDLQEVEEEDKPLTFKEQIKN